MNARISWAGGLALAAAAALCAALALPLTRGEVYLTDDLGTFQVPTRAFYADCLARGESFLWMPSLHCGYYVHGEGQGGFAHPLHLLLYKALPIDIAFGLELVLCYPFAFAGTFLFLRRRRLGADAALVGALLFAFSGWLVLRHVHVNAVAVVAHIPWLLLATDAALAAPAARTRALARLGAGALTASELLLGYPQYVWFSLLVEGLYALVLLRTEPPEGARRPGLAALAGLAAAKALGALAAAVQLLPTADMLATSSRSRPDDAFATSWSLHPGNLVQLVGPYLLEGRVAGPPGATNLHEFGAYAGAVTLVLAALALARRRALAPAERALACAGVGLAVLGLWLALGRWGGLYALQTYVPYLSVFRAPSRYVALAHLGLAVAAAVGFAELARAGAGARERERERVPWPLFVPLAASVVAAGVARTAPEAIRTLMPAPGVAGEVAVLAGPVLAGVALALVVAAARGSRAALAGVVVLAAVDLGAYGLSSVRAGTIASIDRLRAFARLPPGEVPGPPGPMDGRIETDDNALVLNGARLSTGYSGLRPARRLDPVSPLFRRLGGVRWTEVPPAMQHQTGARWLRLQPPLARARLVGRAVPSAAPEADIQAIDVATTALVEAPLALAGGEAPGEARIVADRPGRIRVRTRAADGALLVVAESYHEGWRARLLPDGEWRPALRVNGDFMGVVVGGGEAEVELEFRPRSYARGLALSAAGAGLLVAWTALALLRARARARREGAA